MDKVNFQDVGIVPMFAVNGPEIQFGISIFGVSVATLAVGLALLTGLAFSRHGLRETTLLGPWAWSLIAAGALLACETAVLLYHPGSGVLPNWLIVARFSAFTATFCPTMALMGARRPQSREWKYVVLCLWLILALPAGWSALVRPGRFSIEPIWAVFLLILIVVGSCNYLFTRYWCSSLLYGAGQVALVFNHLPWFSAPAPSHMIATPNDAGGGLFAPLAAAAAFTVALAVAYRVAQRPASRDNSASPENLAPLDRLWLDFRDTFGAVWALRVAQRTNAAAAMYNWNIVLRWDGLHLDQPESESSAASDGEAISKDTVQAVEHNLRGLLRRFVSQAWIDERLSE